MLPGLTDEQCFRRLKEMEETVMSLTNAETPSQAMDRYAIVRPRARLQKLTVRIQKLKERYIAGTPKANLQLLVLDKLEIKRGELNEEIEQIDAVHIQREKPHSPAHETDDGQNHSATPPLADPVINETDERAGTPLTGQLETDQPGVSEPGVTEERVKETKVKKVVRQTLLLAKKTRDDLVKAHDRITAIEADYRDETVLRNNHLRRTEELDEKTSGIVDDLDRLERETEQRLTEVTEDLVSSTLDRVKDLEKKNVSLEDRNDKLEADLKALTEHVAELINAKINADIAVEEANARAAKEVQDTLDEEARRAKEAPRLSEEEIAERERITETKYPGLARSIAAQAAEDAKRLNTERQRLDKFATAHKKKKAASSSSVPAKRKRKISKKAQVAGLLERITETVIDTEPNPGMHFEDEDEEHLEQRSTRQRVLQVVPISTGSQPQAEGSSSRPTEEEPIDDMMDGFRFSESE
ncbi:eukaryotic translation initiation factor 5B-like [Impatiens glandulifera]|uniref:eukaryotic translation initiation factor 5B-like n=1 Tax=Impatiens glandulifera TaxID=253017 RepID=UPI001FB055AA|nr:eukaryotic translation initiation factor 5B-like [Impatiens glandulifera]